MSVGVRRRRNWFARTRSVAAVTHRAGPRADRRSVAVAKATDVAAVDCLHAREVGVVALVAG